MKHIAPRLAAAAAALALTAVGTGTAQAADHVVADGLIGPLRLAVAGDGTAYVAEEFAGQLTRISPDGSRQVVYGENNDVGAVSVNGDVVTFAVSEGEFEHTGAWLKQLLSDGSVRTVADLYSYEVSANPDQVNTYGFEDISPGCAAQVPPDLGPATYTGALDTHPYATLVRGGNTYIADAGANAVLKVSDEGVVSTVALLPPRPIKVTQTLVDLIKEDFGVQLPDCALGLTYAFEPVPTDIEFYRGKLYVSSLPGGPEGPQLGSRGAVFSVDVNTHAVRQVLGGLLGPTGLAVNPDTGTLFVAQMFGDEISRVRFGNGGPTVSTLVSTPAPADVEWGARGLYYTSNVFENGQLVHYGR